jgi:hypothetical protein
MDSLKGTVSRGMGRKARRERLHEGDVLRDLCPEAGDQGIEGFEGMVLEDRVWFLQEGEGSSSGRLRADNHSS